MNQSPEINELAKALALTQAVGLVAIENTKNSHLNSKYADLVAVYEAVREPMAKNGLALAQFPGQLREVGGKHCLSITNMLLHESGQYICVEMEMPVPPEQKGLNPAQLFGLVLTYARRYGLCCVLGVATGDDQDAQEAWRKNEPQRMQATDSSTWQELYDSGAWRSFPAPDDQEMRNLGDLAVSELIPLIKTNLANGASNQSLVAAHLSIVDARAKARGMSLVEAMKAAQWNGAFDLAQLKPDEILVLAKAVDALPKGQP
jgi:hypothetical protein